MIPLGFDYVGHLDRHYSGWRTFDKRPVLPRQIHFYLPSGQEQPCNFRCAHCCGILSKKRQVSWERTGLELIHNLDGAVPFMMFSGAFTEPTLNPLLAQFILETKVHESGYGLKTNGSMLVECEDKYDLVSVLCSATHIEDFVSVSLDAGYAESHSKSKRVGKDQFDKVISGLYLLKDIRGDCELPKIRISYLLNNLNSSENEIRRAIWIAKDIGADSIRFSLPHPPYGTDNRIAKRIFEKYTEYIPYYEDLFSELSSEEKPVVFYVSASPHEKFSRCAYGYYQITLSSDGYVYRCTTAADEIFKELRLGKITSDIVEFTKMLFDNQDPDFNPELCSSVKAYCCRAAVAVNEQAGINA